MLGTRANKSPRIHNSKRRSFMVDRAYFRPRGKTIPPSSPIKPFTSVELPVCNPAGVEGRVPYLEPGQPIYPEDPEAWGEKAGAKIGSGNVVFVRTGRWALRASRNEAKPQVVYTAGNSYRWPRLSRRREEGRRR